MMTPPSADLSTHIGELQSLLDRLADEVRAIEEPDEHAVASTDDIPSTGDVVLAPPTPRRRIEMTAIDRLRSLVIGPFRRCAYCAQWGARLEADRAGIRWQCRWCRHRSRAYSRKRAAKH
jgi:hypothetical protein